MFWDAFKEVIGQVCNQPNEIVTSVCPIVAKFMYLKE